MVVSIPAGRLRHYIGLHVPSEALNAGGELVETFSPTATSNLWAEFNNTGGDEVQEADRTEAQKTGTWTIRHGSGLTEQDRLSFDSRFFRITHIADVGEEKVYQTVDVVEVIPDA